ncbi:MAG: LytTR family DNA-binding domain-containing protein [Bacteroidales bacterium]|nr:LytTR family DNA-binding domain-containing protein [Bacteroidales bacterium]
MRILIIEDEKPAVEKLELLLKKYDPQIEVLSKISTVEKSVSYLKENQKEIDLIFLDIQLTDGLSFDIFKSVKVEKPIIFTTAFNEYAIDAFKLNSIDYLLKPLSFDDLSKAMDKIKSMKENLPSDKPQTNISLDQLAQLISGSNQKYKSRYLVKIGEHIKSIAVEDIYFFYAEGRIVFIITNEKRKFIVDSTLEDLANQLNPNKFFRANRSFIINFDHISDVIVYSTSRLRVKYPFEFEKEIIVSREKVSDFKAWYGGEE